MSPKHHADLKRPLKYPACGDNKIILLSTKQQRKSHTIKRILIKNKQHKAGKPQKYKTDTRPCQWKPHKIEIPGS